MGVQKILDLLNEANDPKFLNRRRIIVNHQSNRNYDARNEVI